MGGHPAAHRLDQKHGWQTGIPGFGRHGFRLEEVPVMVRDAARALLRANLSPAGYERARDLMRLNGCLGELAGAPTLLGEFCYRVHFFGRPSLAEPWGWQFSGHRLCIIFFVPGGRMLMTPVFMGMRAECLRRGPVRGATAFQDEEDKGRLPGRRDREALGRPFPHPESGHDDRTFPQPGRGAGQSAPRALPHRHHGADTERQSLRSRPVAPAPAGLAPSWRG
ncbi:DUF3500 domain-containing protein [Oceanicola sp. S124]|uniref:DUF3500 domain-containing protein n=1 Tax=Oceanicola sp. S124 TaxID=1042378 RepID=UPI00110F6E13|nr:DUF3500 domain-containing protein [Oceanicola sp. S124]